MHKHIQRDTYFPTKLRAHTFPEFYPLNFVRTIDEETHINSYLKLRLHNVHAFESSRVLNQKT